MSKSRNGWMSIGQRSLASIRVLLDTNVALDLFLEREPWLTQAHPLCNTREAGHLIACLCASALTAIFYISRKQVGMQRAKQVVEVCLQGFEIIPVDLAVLQTALALQGNDFEENVQIACALLRGIDLIVTRDVQGFQHSSVPTVEPTFIAQHLPTDETNKTASAAGTDNEEA
jgi:predicted nucleic acid-binding protein